MLMMRLTLKVLDSIETKKIKNLFTTLGLEIIREETVGGCTMVADQIFKVLDMSDARCMG